jgi:hypothetical protein
VNNLTIGILWKEFIKIMFFSLDITLINIHLFVKFISFIISRSLLAIFNKNNYLNIFNNYYIMSVNYLSDYIKENPDCPIDDILNDDEILDELKLNNDILIS